MITSARNKRVAEALKLRKRALREDRRLFLVEGPQAIEEAVRSGSGLDVLFHTPGEVLHPAAGLAGQAGVELVPVSEDVVRQLTSTVTPQGLVGVGRFVDVPLSSLPGTPSLAVVLYAIRDPGNAGTILRSADAAGADAVIFSAESVDVYNQKVVRASAGSIFHLPVVRDADIGDAVEALRARGTAVYAASGRGKRDLYSLDLSGPVAFVFGNEAWGLPDEVESLADETVRIPISDRSDSINLAAAASVCLFEAARQRHRPDADLAALVRGAAHDIRSPLTALTGFTSTLTRFWPRLTNEDRGEMLAGLDREAVKVEGILKDLVDAARLASGGLELSPEAVEVEEVVEAVGARFRTDPDRPDVSWQGEPVRVKADPVRLRSSVTAMVEAAAWWGQEGPVEVRASRSGPNARIEIRRSVTELDPSGAEALMRPRQPGSGAGSKIGLYVAGKVAQAQGGSLAVAVEGGIVLTLILPAA